MSNVVTTLKYKNHNAMQFVESLSEGLRTYGANTISGNANSTILTVSGNVLSSMRVNDILMIGDESRTITDIATNGQVVTINTAFSTAIVNQTFKTREALSLYDTYYVFIGRSVPWANGDSSAPSPRDSEESQLAYLSDALSIRRITSNDLTFVVPRSDWKTNSVYTMYDHRANIAEVVANTTSPMYVRTSTNDVFKCIYNGRTNASASSIKESISEPTITGVISPSDLITSTASDNGYYLWKYLYSISVSDEEKYVTGNYMPVRDVIDTIDPATGDILDDASASFIMFNDARSTANGGIYKIVVENGGSGYTTAPEVRISGDGSGAVATAQLTGTQVTDIYMAAYGQNYSYANVSIISGTGSGATATAIISPRNAFSNTSGLHYIANHGINNKNELYARHVMLYVELSGSEGGLITTANEYRRVGILKNPLLVTGEVATANLYDMTTTLKIKTGDVFLKDEIVYQPETGAHGVIVEQGPNKLRLVNVSFIPFSNSVANTVVIGIGNGNTQAIQALSGGRVSSALPEEFSIIVPASGATATIDEVVAPKIIPRSGEIFYVNHLPPVIRGNTQTEVIRTVLTF